MTNPYIERINALRETYKRLDFEGYIVPSTDPYQNEFVPPQFRRLEWLCGFTGSSGTLLILNDQIVFFTDGRYILQASMELDPSIECVDIAVSPPWEWVATHVPDVPIGVYAYLISVDIAKRYQDAGCDLRLWDTSSLVDMIWTDKPEPLKPKIIAHDMAYAGKDSESKIEQILLQIRKQRCNKLLITSPESICWLLNIRSWDVEYTPLVLSRLLITSDGDLFWYIDRGRVDAALESHLPPRLTIVSPDDLINHLRAHGSHVLWCDPKTTPAALLLSVNSVQLRLMDDPCMALKAIKNDVEIQGAREAHRLDGIALTQCLHWLDNVEDKSQLTELSVMEALLSFRQMSEHFKRPSFETIAGFNDHGAIVHYRATSKTNISLSNQGLLLIDSGGQYPFGTTDVTRTIAFGQPTREQKYHYTLVLKGHIAVASAIFDGEGAGKHLDQLARKPLQEVGKNYAHGTGHGVGSYLSVHEGPIRISHVAPDVPFSPGMILSNEPGYYENGAYGIRIENLELVIDQGGKLAFETLTLAPIDKRLIEVSMLTESEIAWYNTYHDRVRSVLSPNLPNEVNLWLEQFRL